MSLCRCRSTGLARGFTLLEVLVALAIVAIVLAACLRGVGALINSSRHLEQKLMASWCADNRIKHIQIEKLWPDIGTRKFGCMQGRYQFMCNEVVTSTSYADVRSVEVRVSGEDDQVLFAQSRYMAVKYEQ